jgi:hypothetical protein
MILSVHAIFGAAVASLVPNHPGLGFALGFASHLALDMIPHRDYDLISVDKIADNKLKFSEGIFNKFRLLRDMAVVSLDAVLGLILAFMFFFNPVYPLAFIVGAFGSLLPDFLTFVYLVIKHRSLELFYNFHASFVHSKIILNLNQVVGVFFQFCTLGLLIAIMLGVRYYLF